LVFGDSEGFVNYLSRDFSSLESFRAYEGEGGVSHLLQLKQSNVLVTLGNDEKNNSPNDQPTVKFWNLDKLDKTGTNPLCLKSLRLWKITVVVGIFFLFLRCL
jgi:hypothetical protein